MMDINPEEYIFVVRTVQSSIIKTLFDTIKDVFLEINIIVDSNGLFISKMNSDHTVLIHASLKPTNFELFISNRQKVVGVNLKNVFKFLKTTSNGETITLCIKKDTPDNLDIILENSEKNTVKKCSVTIMFLDEKRIDIPAIEFDAIINMPTGEFQEAIKNLYSVSDTVLIESVDNRVKFTSEGDSGSITIDMGEFGTAGSGTGVGVETTCPYACGKFSLKFLNSMAKSGNLCNSVDIYLKNDSPLALIYRVSSLGTVKYLLAPKVMEEF